MQAVIERYSRAPMADLFSDQRRFERYLDVELAAAEAMEAEGYIPQGTAQRLRERARVSLERISELERTVGHDVIAFTTAVAEAVGSEGRYLHYGLTSSDVVDTALSLTLLDALDRVVEGLDRVRSVLARRAREERQTLMIGRTHGVHAEPISLGLKFARWWDALGRDRERLELSRRQLAFGKLSGAVGTYAHLPPTVEARAMERLGLKPAPISSQILDRDRHATAVVHLALLASTLDAVAVEVRSLQRTEIGELREPFGPGQKGSSAMPHKRNPVRCERISGLARVMRGYAVTAMENIPLWGERDISHSSAERVVLADAFVLIDYLLAETEDVLEGLEIDRERMRANLELTDGRVFSGSVLLALVDAGVSREEAYAWVQAAALDPAPGFRERLLAHPEIRRLLGPEGLAQAMDPGRALAHTDAILERLGLR
jgi:adenylosuccinate lyase